MTKLPEPILPIIRMGHPTLRRVAEPVSLPVEPAIKQLAQNMISTMLDAPGVGLAAPQVNAGLRIIVYQVPASRIGEGEKGKPLGPQVLINPELTPLSDEQKLGMEGCLSIPGLKGDVPRYRHIGFTGFDVDGQPVEGEAFDFHARVLQHEVDHLDGVLYLDRIDDMTSLGYLDVMLEGDDELVEQPAEGHPEHDEDPDGAQKD